MKIVKENVRRNRFRQALKENARRRRLTEADDDIRVPFKLSQADMMDPKSLDLKSIGKKLIGQEKDRRAEVARQERNAQLRQQYANIFDIIAKDPNGAVVIEELFKELVPGSGQAEIVAGELTRAANKIGYRWNNDGDILFIGYGIETCSNAINYIISIIPSVENDVYKLSDRMQGTTDKYGFYNDHDSEVYDEFLNNLYQTIVDWINDNPEEALQPAEDMFSEQFDDESWLKELEPKEEVEVSVGNYCWELERYLDEFGDMIHYSTDDALADFGSDIEWDLEQLGGEEIGFHGYRVRDYLNYELPLYNVREFEDRVTQYFEDKLKDLEDEYGTYEDLEEKREAEENEEEDYYDEEEEELPEE